LLIDDTLANVTAAKEKGWEAYFYKGDFENLKKFIEVLLNVTTP
jgi:hypothetical protein